MLTTTYKGTSHVRSHAHTKFLPKLYHSIIITASFRNSIFAWVSLLLINLASLANKPEITIVWATENFIDGSRNLENESGNPLSAGLEGNQNGAIVELGYFRLSNGEYINDDSFSGIWTPLTYGTHIGDSSTGYGFGDGKFSFTTTFTKDSESVVIYPTEPKEFSENLVQAITTQNPPAGTHLYIRFYSNTSRLPAERKYNTVTGTNWKWPNFPTGEAPPDNIYLKISDESNSASTWELGNTFEANGANERFRTVLREKFDLNLLVKDGTEYGSGTVSIEGGGVNGNFDAGPVNITATAESSTSFFMYWEGDGVTNANSPSTSVNLNSHQNITAVFAKNIYSVSITVIGQGSVTQNGLFQEENIYEHGDQLSLVAYPNNGHDFAGWAYAETPSAIITLTEEQNYTMTQNLQLVAVFEPKQYDLNFSTQTQSTGEVLVYSSNGEIASEFFFGEVYELYAAPATHHVFDRWVWTDGAASPLAPGESTNSPVAQITPNADLNITAIFITQQYTLNILSTTGADYISPSSGNFPATQLVQVSTVPLEGYEFVHWSDPFSILVNSSSLTTEANMSKLNGTEATITAVYRPKEYNSTRVRVSAGTGGSVNLESNGAGNFTHFEKYSLTATPTSGYRFVRWEGAGSETALLHGANSQINELHIHGMVDINLTATFETSEFFINTNVSPVPHSGSIEGGGGFTILDDPVLRATPSSGWQFSHWSGEDTDFISDLNAATTFVHVDDRNFSFTANFDPINYNIQINAHEGGTFIAYHDDNFSDNFANELTSHVEVLNYDDEFSVLASENVGWEFDQWFNLPNEYLSQISSPIITSIYVTEDMNITAKFKKLSNHVEFNFTDGGTVSGSGVYTYGENVTISATPEDHFSFHRWVILSPDDLNTSFLNLNSASQTFLMPALSPSERLLLKAEFTPNQYEVNVSSLNPSQGTVSLVGKFAGTETTGPEFNASSEILITATPADSSHIFKSWSWASEAGITGTSSDPTLLIPYLEDNYDITAEFSVKPSGYIDYNRSVFPAMAGYIESNDSLSISPWQTLTASPYPGFSFIGWTAVDENNLTISISPHLSSHQIDLNVTESDQVTAHFVKSEYKLYFEYNSSNGTISHNQVSYNLNDSAEVTATPTSTHSFTNWSVDHNLSDQPFHVSKEFSSLNPLESRLFVDDSEAPELHLVRGFTYQFDYDFSDASYIFFSTDQDSHPGSGNSYLSGVSHNEITNQIIFTVPSDAPDALYYCLSSMPYAGNRINVIDLSESELLPHSSQPSIKIPVPADIKIKANFDRARVSVAKNTIGSGDIQIVDNEPFYLGNPISIQAIPHANWEFVRWENTSTVENIYDENTTFTPIENTTLTALFKLKNFELSLPVEPSGFGTTRTQSNETRFGWGDTANIIATPRNGKIFQYWLFEDNSTIRDESISVTIHSDLSIKAVFSAQTFDIDLSVITLDENGSIIDAVNGGAVSTINNSQNYSFEHEELAELTSVAYPGYQFVRWENADLNSTESNWSNEILYDQDLKAYFQRIPYSINVTATAPSRGKLIYAGNEVTEIRNTMIYGENLTVEAVANEGFRFEKWLVVPDGTISNPKSASLSLNITKNMTISPLFVTVEDIPIFISVYPQQAGYVVGNGEFPYNENHPIFAQNRKGWIFERWEGEGIKSSTSANTTVLLDQSKELTARFKLTNEASEGSGSNSGTTFTNNSFLLVVTENEKSFGDASGSGFYESGSIPISASPFAGYEFIRWEGSGVDDIYSKETQVLIQNNQTVTAHFQKLGLFEDSTSVGDGWWSSGNFGFFFKIEGTEWYFHETLGWIIMRQAEDARGENDSFWVWVDRLSTWAWMKKSKYPHMYAEGEILNGWIWIDPELSAFPQIVLYQFDDKGQSSSWMKF